MRCRIPRATAWLLGACVLLTASAGRAAIVSIDFVGTVSFAGQLAGTTTPLGLDLADFQVGDPLIGYATYDTDRAAWTTTADIAVARLSDWTDDSQPLAADVVLQFPRSRVTLDPGGLSPTPDRLAARVTAAESFEPSPGSIRPGSLRVRAGQPAAVSGLQIGFDLFANGGALNATSGFTPGSFIPSVVNLDQFTSRTVTFSAQGLSGFAITQDIIVTANVSAPPASTPVNGPLFGGFGTFEATDSGGDIAGWTVGGPGTATLVTPPGGSQGVLLTTGSPVSLSQLIDTPTDPFELVFDYQFLTTTGALDVTLGGIVLGTLAAPAALTGAFATAAFTVDAPSLLGQSALALVFGFDGLTGSQILLDNVAARAVAVDPPPPTGGGGQSVPAPATAWLALVGLGALGARGRRGKPKPTT